MTKRPIKNIVIVGGGTAGWMTAAALSRFFSNKNMSVKVIESDAIGRIGVGEATLPHIRAFNASLGLDEADFIRVTKATIKLGIEFCDWGRKGDAYLHPFGDFGRDLNGIDFHHLWLKLRQNGDKTPIGDYSLPVVAAQRGRCELPGTDLNSVMSSFSYAYQFDASLYAGYMQNYAQKRGVSRREGKVIDVLLDGETGEITSVKMEDGEEIKADFFIDCSGFRGILIEKTYKAGFEDWSQWLICNRAVAVPCRGDGDFSPYTRATALASGWKWRIPLQHRVGNGYVYSSDHISDDEATSVLLSGLEGPQLSEPSIFKFTAGRRKEFWIKNCVAVGLSCGLLEPLESTSIYLIQIAITNLLELFPEHHPDSRDIAEYNRVMVIEYERIRDFLILHYCATERDDSPFWNYVRTMEIPESLTHKINIFRERGLIQKYKDGLFLYPSWVAVFNGQRISATGYDPRVDGINFEKLSKHLYGMKAMISDAANDMPKHEDFLNRICAFPDVMP